MQKVARDISCCVIINICHVFIFTVLVSNSKSAGKFTQPHDHPLPSLSNHLEIFLMFAGVSLKASS